MKDMRTLLALRLAAAIGFHALAAQDTPDQSQDIAWMNAQQAYLTGLSAEDGWRVMPGGLRWRYVDYAGSTQSPRRRYGHRALRRHFHRWRDLRFQFRARRTGNLPLNRLVKAWQMAIPEMGVGDTIEIAAPADLAYGPRGKGPIPGGATLLFTVQLLGIEPAA